MRTPNLQDLKPNKNACACVCVNLVRSYVTELDLASCLTPMPFQAFTHLNSLDLPPSLSLSLPLSPSFLAIFFRSSSSRRNLPSSGSIYRGNNGQRESLPSMKITKIRYSRNLDKMIEMRAGSCHSGSVFQRLGG